MSDRPKRLYYTGRGAIPGVPRRDLEERDVARLSDAKLVDVMGKHPRSGRATYQVTKPGGRAADTPPAQESETPDDETGDEDASE